MMRRPILTLLLLVLCLGCVAQDFPKRIFSGYQGDFHVQGAAYDRQRQCVYMSFTTKLMKYDLQGRLIASVNGLTGHLGCIGINPDDGRLYGSLEYKHDVIGTGITGNLGVKNDARTGFYVAIFDLDKIDRIDMSPDEVMTTVYIPEVVAEPPSSTTVARWRIATAHRASTASPLLRSGARGLVATISTWATVSMVTPRAQTMTIRCCSATMCASGAGMHAR